MALFPSMLDWIQQIWETLQTRVESVEWSCEVDHIPLVSLTRKTQRQRVFNRFYSLLAGNSDSDSDVLQDVYRQATATSEEAGDAKSRGTVWQQQNKAENDCRRHWKRNCDADVAKNHLEGFCRSCYIFSFFDSISSVQSVHFFSFTETNHVPHFTDWFWQKLKVTVLSLRFCPSSTLSNKKDLRVKYTFQNTPQPQ